MCSAPLSCSFCVAGECLCVNLKISVNIRCQGSFKCICSEISKRPPVHLCIIQLFIWFQLNLSYELKTLGETRRMHSVEWKKKSEGFIIASVAMLIICSFILKCRAKFQSFDRLWSEKQLSGFLDYEWLSLAGNNFKAAAFPQKG